MSSVQYTTVVPMKYEPVRKEREMMPIPNPVGVKITVNRDVIHSCNERTVEANLDRAMKTLSVLYGIDVTADHLRQTDAKIELYWERA